MLRKFIEKLTSSLFIKKVARSFGRKTTITEGVNGYQYRLENDKIEAHVNVEDTHYTGYFTLK
jgi:hypothetical protein